MSEAEVIQLEHELGIAGHESDCPRCKGLKAVEEGRCHEVRHGYVISVTECPHDVGDLLGVKW